MCYRLTYFFNFCYANNYYKAKFDIYHYESITRKLLPPIFEYDGKMEEHNPEKLL